IPLGCTRLGPGIWRDPKHAVPAEVIETVQRFACSGSIAAEITRQPDRDYGKTAPPHHQNAG
ncbi:MAG: hypothetical protein WCK17_17055, partial [Verrucomicrobiota bacterium]